MSDDPLNGVSAQALAAAEGLPRASDRPDPAVDEVVAPLASSERAFESRTREAARRRAIASRGTVGALADASARMGERGRRIVDDGWDALPEPREMLRQSRTAIQDRPSTALLIAGAIGFGLGWLIHHRNGSGSA